MDKPSAHHKASEQAYRPVASCAFDHSEKPRREERRHAEDFINLAPMKALSRPDAVSVWNQEHDHNNHRSLIPTPWSTMSPK